MMGDSKLTARIQAMWTPGNLAHDMLLYRLAVQQRQCDRTQGEVSIVWSVLEACDDIDRQDRFAFAATSCVWSVYRTAGGTAQP